MDGNRRMLLPLPKKRPMNSTVGYAPPKCSPVWCEEPGRSCSSRRARASLTPVASLEWGAESCDFGFVDSMPNAIRGLKTSPAGGESPLFPPEVALHLVKIACEMPDSLWRSISLWDCRERARKLEEDGIVERISARAIKGSLTP